MPRGRGASSQPVGRICQDCGTWVPSGQKGVGSRCGACYQKWRRAGYPGRDQETLPSGRLSADRREVRNDLPEFKAYVYRGAGYDIYEGPRRGAR